MKRARFPDKHGCCTVRKAFGLTRASVNQDTDSFAALRVGMAGWSRACVPQANRPAISGSADSTRRGRFAFDLESAARSRRLFPSFDHCSDLVPRVSGQMLSMRGTAVLSPLFTVTREIGRARFIYENAGTSRPCDDVADPADVRPAGIDPHGLSALPLGPLSHP